MLRFEDFAKNRKYIAKMIKIVTRIDFSRLRRRGLWSPPPKKSMVRVILFCDAKLSVETADRSDVMQFESNDGQRSCLRVSFGVRNGREKYVEGWRDGGLSLDARVGLGKLLGDQ